MRAKTVNEDVNFERGRNPKESMGIGGLELSEEFEERMDQLKMKVDGIKATEDEDWINYLEETFIGKKITAEMTTMPFMNLKSKEMSGKRETGKFSIEVQDIKLTDNLSDIMDSPITRSYPKIIVADMENNIYEMKMNQKIYFD
jgi:hypothetical protein